MKKILIGVFVLLVLSINFAFAQNPGEIKLILLSEEPIEVSSSQYVIDSSNKTSLIKGSTLDVSYVYTEDFVNVDEEPDVDIVITNSDSETVWSASSPREVAPDPNEDIDAFDLYFEKYSNIFQTLQYNGNTLNLKIPLNLEEGVYTVDITSPNFEQIKLNYEFSISKSPYYLVNSSVILEEGDLLANFEYKSSLAEPTKNKVKITVVKPDNSVVFEKEFEKEFYQEGAISLQEELNIDSAMTEPFTIKVEVFNAQDEVVMDFSESFNQDNVGVNWVFYIIVFLVLVLIAGLLIYFVKNKKIQIVSVAFLSIISALGFWGNELYAQQCGGVSKPANVCTENLVQTFACKLSSSCSTTDVRTKKFFSTGKILNIASARQQTGPVSTSINVCNEIAGLSTGNAFYVAVDSNGSDWQNKRYYIYRFVRGTSASKEFDSGNRKRNVQSASYNGACNVTVSSQYKGPASNFKQAKVTIVEAGKIDNSMCRSQYVTSDLFESMGDLMGRSVCTNNQLGETFLAGGVPVNVVNTSPATDKTVNICNYITKTNGDNFYVLMEHNTGWWYFKYPVFRFQFGTANSASYDYSSNLTQTQLENNFYFTYAYKEHLPLVKYDGNCTITFKTQRRGHSTDVPTTSFTLLEAGLVSDVTCKDPRVTQSTTATSEGAYKWWNRGIENGEPEIRAKRDRNMDGTNDGGIYGRLAPFMNSLPDCKSLNQCSTTGEWVQVSTDTDCGDGVCSTTTLNSCQFGTYRARDNTATMYRWYCDALSPGTNAQCSLPITQTLTVSKAGTGIGSISTNPAGISCGNNCTETKTADFVKNSTVTITATHNTTSQNISWSGGGCAGSGASCTVTMDQNRNVTVTFTPKTYSITYNANSATSGTVPASQTKTHGQDINLRTNTGNLLRDGFTFGGWNTLTSGGGTNYSVGQNYTENANLNLHAKWNQNQVNGSCGTANATCSQGTLNHSPADTATQYLWTCQGLNGGTNASCSLNKPVYTLTTSKNIVAGGTVMSSPAGISCGADCTENYTSGTNVTLSAVEAINYRFNNWTGAINGTSLISPSIGMSASRSVTANFALIPIPPSASATCSANGTQATVTWTRPAGYTQSYFRFSPSTDLTDRTRWLEKTTVTTQTVSVTPGVAYNWWVNTAYSTANYSTSRGGSITCTPQTYTRTLSFNAGGGSGTMNPISCTATTSNGSCNVTIPANTFTNTGRVFTNWTLNPGNTPGYQSGQVLSIGTNYTLTANWALIPPPTNASATCSANGTQATVTWTRPAGYTASYFRFSPSSNLSDRTRWLENTTVTTQTVSVTPGVQYNWWIHTAQGTSNYSASVGGQITCTPQTYTRTLSFDGNGENSGSTPQRSCTATTSNGSCVITIPSNGFSKSNHSFNGWSAVRNGPRVTNTGASYSISSNQTLYALWTSDPTIYRLNVTRSGSGTITSNPAGINCGSDCTQDYTTNTSVQLTATAADGYQFVRWIGSCSSVDSNRCTVVMSSPRTIQAEFQLIDGPPEPPVVGDFTFNPKVVAQGEMCRLTLEASNVQSCTVINRLNQVIGDFTANPANIINETNQTFSIGTYRLSCIDLDGAPYEHPTTISCSTNADIDEF